MRLIYETPSGLRADDNSDVLYQFVYQGNKTTEVYLKSPTDVSEDAHLIEPLGYFEHDHVFAGDWLMWEVECEEWAQAQRH